MNRSSGSMLATVLDEFDDLDPVGEGGEQSAGLDGRELLRVADEDHLGLGSVRLADEVGHQRRAEHSGLVDHQDVAGAAACGDPIRDRNAASGPSLR